MIDPPVCRERSGWLVLLHRPRQSRADKCQRGDSFALTLLRANGNSSESNGLQK
jgi:hypothetical protein